ncbi:MAG: serine O-acetyltransferase [Polyangia bacterium]
MGTSSPPPVMPTIAERLVASYAADQSVRIAPGHELPSPPEIRQAITELRELLFPGATTTSAFSNGSPLLTVIEARVEEVRARLARQVYRGLHHRCDKTVSDCGECHGRAVTITDGFLDALPGIRATLLEDVRAAYDGDPAASGTDEVVFAYPGIHAITVYRLAHHLFELGARIVPRIMVEQSHSETGIDIHPAAVIGAGFFIDHGTGVVIGETSTIGNRVRIYQGVTLGALSLPTSRVRALSTEKRHPTIEDDVIIYANATILGGKTVIGKGAIIGGNCWITESVPPGARRSV